MVSAIPGQTRLHRPRGSVRTPGRLGGRVGPHSGACGGAVVFSLDELMRCECSGLGKSGHSIAAQAACVGIRDLSNGHMMSHDMRYAHGQVTQRVKNGAGETVRLSPTPKKGSATIGICWNVKTSREQ